MQGSLVSFPDPLRRNEGLGTRLKEARVGVAGTDSSRIVETLHDWVPDYIAFYHTEVCGLL